MARKKKSTQTDNTPLFNQTDEERMKALDTALSDLTKRYGDGAIVRLGEATHMTVETIPSGSLGIDIALGVGGIPRGRITEIYGPESSGKTTLCLHIIAEAQRRGGIGAFIDMEHALDPTYAGRIGVDTTNLLIAQPDTGEQAMEITESLVRSGALDVVVVDSVAALVPRAEIEGEMGDSHVGLQARLMSQALRKLTGAIKQSGVSVIFTNQLREKVGVMFGCFSYQTEVLLADGSSMPIGKIVNQKLPVDVLSWNQETGCFEAKPVVSWFKNGVPVDEFNMTDSEIGALTQGYITLLARYPDGSGFTKVTSTPNHQIATPEGFVQAQFLDLDDQILAYYDFNGEAVAMPMTIEEVRFVRKRGDEALRYNLEVDGNATYIADDGVIVHNSPETTPGGRALKFYSSVRIDIRRIQSIKSGQDNIGNRTKVKIKKNKVAPPFRETEFDIMFAEGISKTGEIVDLGQEIGIIEKRGAFYRYNDELLGQGRENAKVFLRENPSMASEIENAIRKHFELPTLEEVAEAVVDEPAPASESE